MCPVGHMTEIEMVFIGVFRVFQEEVEEED
jgi:hypothetical protein